MKAYLEPERVTMPVRLALHWAQHGLMPPNLYALPFRVAFLTIRAFNRLCGNEDPPPKGDGGEREPDDGS